MESIYAPHMTETRHPYLIDADPCPFDNGGEAASFPGCETLSMDANQFAACDRHVEYWDARRDLAWMVRDVSVEHERPGSRLSTLVYRMAQIRGSDIECYSTVSLHDRDADGDVRVMEADQTIYLDAARARALRSPVLVRQGEAPDVALEVDHTTDARRRKLGVYENWEVAEVWIEVPDAPARSRPKSRRSGLTIHALDACTKRYEEAEASSVLPGWTAEDIHLALNETAISPRTWAAVERVGRALGRKEGTDPAHDPIQRRQLLAAQAKGRKAGRRAGRKEGRANERAATVRAILAQRGIGTPPAFLANAAARQPLLAHDTERIITAASQCLSAPDFLARLVDSQSDADAIASRR